MTNNNQFKDFSYCFSNDLNFPLRIKILSLEGYRKPDSYSDLSEFPDKRFSGLNLAYFKSDLLVELQLFSNGLPMGEKVQTRYQQFTKSWCWNETLTLPISINNLPYDSMLYIEVSDILKPMQTTIIGGCCLSLFTSNCKLRTGKQKLTIKPITNEEDFYNTCFKEYDEIDRLDKLVKKQEAGDLEKLEWLDKMTFLEIEKIKEKETLLSNKLFLYIELPKFDFPLIFHEMESQLPVGPIHRGGSNLIVIADMEMYNDNPVEEKHRRLVRSHRSVLVDKELKPNSRNRDQLNKIIKYPPTQLLTSEEKDLLWKFRFYLKRDKKALTKFLKCVMWSDTVESSQAVTILEEWSDIEIEDALELLGPNFVDPRVRGYAVKLLEKAADDELLLYLLQLVQALKFEETTTEQSMSSLGEFLLLRGTQNFILGNRFIWYIKVECNDKKHGLIYQKLLEEFELRLKNFELDSIIDIIHQQTKLIDIILVLSKQIRLSKDIRTKKIEKFKHTLSDPKFFLNTFDPIPFPLDASIHVIGVIPDKCTVFKSNLSPLKLMFKTTENLEYPVMFKYGDDLRQDQLVIQIIMLMDNLLRAENLDLKLSPYKVLATGNDEGLIQFIPSMSLATILNLYDNSLLSYLKQNHFDQNAPLNIQPYVLDNYLKSCAGYCVITYLLGVGDRHLDNLLLTQDGKLFHIDFGYFLGRDPKPFPPPMKLCKEMVEAMGGANSPQYAKFLSYCFVAFNSLRKSANLILNLLSLMLDADIPDIAIEPDKAVMKVQEKFCLEMSDEEAIQHFQTLVNESVSALFPQVIETIHKWAQYWRK
ncbi:phosphatidylinositol 3-kinase [Neoconidiobolus thromboides FSU 785]|nr:phosphatidylinositol 3-kinase [Neoconidiobolus thromboides FSU 785]